MRLNFFQIQELIELEPTVNVLDLMSPEVYEQLKHVDERSLKLGFMIQKEYPSTTEADINQTMQPHELKYKSKELELEKLTASEFITLDSKPDWNEFFKLVLVDWKDGDYISWYEGNQHLQSFMVGLQK